MAPKTDFPPVRACLFDMDGLLLDTEDLYTLCVNKVLAQYDRPPMPWSVKARLQGRPGPAANQIFSDWAKLPISTAEYSAQLSVFQKQFFGTAKPLPGVPQLLQDLDATKGAGAPSGNPGAPPHAVHMALATSSHRANFDLKTTHLQDLFSVFPEERRVKGDDTRLAAGRGKPLPDIFLLALQTVNDSLPAGEPPITPQECLVFEDSVPGVEAGRRAGMRVVWCPHPMLKKEVEGREAQILAGRTGEAGDVDLHQVGEIDDGWAEYLETLENFPYEHYGIVIPKA
ncbi:HAD superfamily hydrolase, putative [Cordyceps militaris CM01]|uniref:HAD superfamily hydrolase, putative n=1 Tax=Cordyceps militaris (strain CM01) TaxID=983644 RepID=G3JKQ7_CORMM|nr:HAD superfamily hydrolase, putative [Cordyceps militaris CM01]EGX91496.1 HAD superfamily hydrolase, putative [Cordyceps militaris CM01]